MTPVLMGKKTGFLIGRANPKQHPFTVNFGISFKEVIMHG